jgi:type II secretory pathway pseudopilin PulG
MVTVRAPRPRHGEAGFNLVILMMAVTVMMILVAAALPAWSNAVRRDKEEELIFRGLQYAEAMRVFQQRFGTLPSRLDDLVKTEPRSIRQLFPDPMTGKVDWVVIRANAPADTQGGQSLGGEVGVDDGREPEEGGEAEASGGLDGGLDGSVGMGPIRGVRSRSQERALKTFLDKDRYDQWLFTVELLQGPPNLALEGVGVPAQQGGLKLSARWIGRPFRPGLQNPATTGLGQPFPPTNLPPQQDRPRRGQRDQPQDSEPDEDDSGEDDGGGP